MSMTSGCDICFGEDADAAWNNRPKLGRVLDIVAESHFSVRILQCNACGQKFVSVFCEEIDWSGGNDPQETLLIPVSEMEIAGLIAAGERGVEEALEKLAPVRRHLVSVFPRTASQSTARFVTGSIFVPRHD